MSDIQSRVNSTRTSVALHLSTFKLLESARHKGETKEQCILRLLSFQSNVKKMEHELKRLQEINQVDPQVAKLREDVLEALAKLEQADIEG